jgi:hypothetical protein
MHAAVIAALQEACLLGFLDLRELVKRYEEDLKENRSFLYDIGLLNTMSELAHISGEKWDDSPYTDYADMDDEQLAQVWGVFRIEDFSRNVLYGPKENNLKNMADLSEALANADGIYVVVYRGDELVWENDGRKA